jgi:hypothetical protein
VEYYVTGHPHHVLISFLPVEVFASGPFATLAIALALLLLVGMAWRVLR